MLECLLCSCGDLLERSLQREIEVVRMQNAENRALRTAISAPCLLKSVLIKKYEAKGVSSATRRLHTRQAGGLDLPGIQSMTTR